MQDAWRSYLALAMGLTEAPRRKAQETARRLVGAGGATAVQLQALAEELVSTSAANREALTKLVRFEVERALGAVGLATADEVTELTRRVRELERQLRETPNGSPAALAASGTVADVDADRSTAPGGAAEPALSPLAAAPAAAEAPSSGRTVTAPSPAKKTVAKKTVTKETVARKTVARKTVATETVAKKTASGKPGADRPATELSAAPRSAKKAPGRQRPGGPE
ncbi:phasin family protein [Salinispora cortesiana]|uniref:phasin family protein n=1 Tax=Salinispora cortesiana TaxID=1305843 RepID=UPI00040BF1DD|nr:hypothetical protein [Salinispora cortesiana]